MAMFTSAVVTFILFFSFPTVLPPHPPSQRPTTPEVASLVHRGQMRPTGALLTLAARHDQENALSDLKQRPQCQPSDAPYRALIRTHLEMHVEPRNPTVFHTAQRGSPMTRNKGSCIRGLQFPRIPNAVPVSLYANPSPPYLRPRLIYIALRFSIAFILLTTGGELRERLRTEGARIGKIASHR